MSRENSSDKKLTFHIEKTEPLYSGFFQAARYYFRHTLFRGGETPTVAREVFLRTPAAAVLLYDDKLDNVVLIEQFRVGPMIEAGADTESAWMLEIVAGIAEPGEKPEDVVLRESVEESGCTITELKPIFQYYPSPGACNEVIHLFCGITDSSKAGGIHGLDSENEDIRVHVISAVDALAMLDDGNINNATTIIALQWLRTYRNQG
ncbi:NUDIX domain-containing protein [Parendozoicomonas sp. Alg238-R29]|uniref:NUDIX domain-containing protein n=1 Tax=Parendozoicomonas sp. Alg238-R29 TaxID=2993446 RepID=UPI00248E8BF4|nr:NUDIX domain-containing protein [Parendozoicomonas sp. Alg238-R29]